MKDDFQIDFDQDMEIDHESLDVEWLNQAPLARKYAKYLSECKDEVDRLEEKKKDVRADLYNEAMKDPQGTMNKDKATDSGAESYIQRHERYKEVVDNLLDAKKELHYADLCYKQISFTRKEALENLVQLYRDQYFAGPSVPRDLDKEIQKKKQTQKNSNKAVKIKRNK